MLITLLENMIIYSSFSKLGNQQDTFRINAKTIIIGLKSCNLYRSSVFKLIVLCFWLNDGLVIFVFQERERRRYHGVLVRTLEARKRYEERERRKECVKEEKRVFKER